jgi:hypothetical protein
MEWEEWLEEEITWPRHSEAGLARWRVISTFVKDGLIPLFKSRGYVFYCDTKALCSRIATGLYNNQNLSSLDSDWAFEYENIDYISEEKGHYYHIMNHGVWERFWQKWEFWEDVQEESFRGLDRRRDIEDYCWTQVNLDGSPQTRKMMELLGIHEDTILYGDSVNTNKNKDHLRTMDDIYLKESIESGQYGGYRR